MRGKRSKQYRKLMHQYQLAFGFREPYQVLLDADVLLDAARFKMDLIHMLERTLHGKIKPMITQCSMRHLYAHQDKPEVIDQAKTFERRRCNHHTLEKPLNTLECFSAVVDAKDGGINKHRYVIATQEQVVRSYMRQVAGVPLIYIHRSVMIMEPMANVSEDMKNKEERKKFRAGLKSKFAKSVLGKRSRDDADEMSEKAAGEGESGQTPEEGLSKKRKKGQKQPNPLSVLKPKKRTVSEAGSQAAQVSAADLPADSEAQSVKKKRKRKPSKHIPSATHDPQVEGGEDEAASSS